MPSSSYQFRQGAHQGHPSPHRSAPMSKRSQSVGGSVEQLDSPSRHRAHDPDGRSPSGDGHVSDVEEGYEEIAMHEIQESASRILEYTSQHIRLASSFGSSRSLQQGGVDYPALPAKGAARTHQQDVHGGARAETHVRLAPSTTSLATGVEEAPFAFQHPHAFEGSTADLVDHSPPHERSRRPAPTSRYRRAVDTSRPTADEWYLGRLYRTMLTSSDGIPITPEEAWEPVMALMASLQTLGQPLNASSDYVDLQQRRSRSWKPLPPLPPTEVGFEQDDPENPHSWSSLKRWLITAIMGAAMFNATFASTVANGAMSELAPALGLSAIEKTLMTTLFVGGCIAGPVFWAPLSELYGRRTTFLASTGLYTIVQIACARAGGKATLLAFRFLSGAFASSALTNAGGVITDMFPPMVRGGPMIVFSSSPFLGPVVGPLVGGAIVTAGSWPWVFWLLFMIGIFLEVMMLAFLPETYAPLILSRKARRKREETNDPRWYAPLDRMDKSIRSIARVNLARPLVMVCTEPIVTSATVFMSYLFALLYIFFVSWPSIFGHDGVYGFGPVNTGLSFLPMGLGCALAAASIPVLNRVYVRACRKACKPCPEKRLIATFPVGPCVAVGFLWAGWSASAQVHWIVPMSAGVPIGFGMVLVFQGWLTYLGDCYRTYAASAVAGSVIVRSMAGATLPLAVGRLQTALGGIEWLYTLLAALALLLTPMPFVFTRYGPSLRAKSAYRSS